MSEKDMMGKLVWVTTDQGFSLPASVVSTDPLIVKHECSQKLIDVKNASLLRDRLLFDPDVENLANLPDSSETSILYSIHARFRKNQFYSFAGDILIAINSYKNHENPDDLAPMLYRNKPINKLPAHIYSIAEKAFSRAITVSSQESICFSGDSGAGKSAQLKNVLYYFIKSSADPRISINQINSVLQIFEAFCGAKTLKNANATRSGCLIELLLRRESVVGLAINSLLPIELSRICNQKYGESNFRIFYYLCEHNDIEEKRRYGLKDCRKYFFLNQNSHGDEEIDDLNAKYSEFKNSLTDLEMSTHQQDFIARVLAVILHIGNLFFQPIENEESNGSNPGVEARNKNELIWAAHLLEIDYELLSCLFTTKTVKTGDEIVKFQLGIVQALDARDSLAQFLYNQLFRWIISRVTSHLQCANYSSTINLIDCYGFEHFNKSNAFEQFCINLTNERLYNHYQKKVLKNVEYDYKKEEINIDYQVPSWTDNEAVIKLIVARPDGLLPALEDESKFPKASFENYLQRCNLNHFDKPNYQKSRTKGRAEFGIKHFAGLTFYDVRNFIDKNRYNVSETLISTLAQSRNTFVAQVFRDAFNNKSPGDNTNLSMVHQTNRSVGKIIEKIDKGNNQFVVCLRANNERHPDKFCEFTVHRQIHSFCITEAVRIHRCGFPCQETYESFASRYQCLLPAEVSHYHTIFEISKDILEQQGNGFVAFYQLGKTIVVMKEELKQHLENKRNKKLEKCAILIQKNVRRMLAKRRFDRKKDAAIILQSSIRAWKARNEVTRRRSELRKIIDFETRKSRRLNLYEQNVLNDVVECSNSSSAHENSADDASKLENEQHNECAQEIDDQRNEPQNSLRCVAPLSSMKQQFQSTHSKRVPDFQTPHLYEYLRKKIMKSKPVATSMAEYFERYCKGHLFEARRQPILTPFLAKETDFDSENALELFKLILNYTNDTEEISDHAQLESARAILQNAINSPQLHDELYIQLCNQTFKNPVKKSVEKAWTLLLAACNCFPPSKQLLPALLNYVEAQPENLSALLVDSLVRCITKSENLRLFAPTFLEQISFLHRQPCLLSICGPGEFSCSLDVDSWSTCEEMSEKYLKARGVCMTDGWTVAVDAKDKVIHASGSSYIFDVIAQLEATSTNDDSIVPFFMFPKIQRPKNERCTANDLSMHSEKSKEVISRANHPNQNNSGTQFFNDSSEQFKKSAPSPQNWNEFLSDRNSKMQHDDMGRRSASNAEFELDPSKQQTVISVGQNSHRKAKMDGDVNCCCESVPMVNQKIANFHPNNQNGNYGSGANVFANRNGAMSTVNGLEYSSQNGRFHEMNCARAPNQFSYAPQQYALICTSFGESESEEAGTCKLRAFDDTRLLKDHLVDNQTVNTNGGLKRLGRENGDAMADGIDYEKNNRVAGSSVVYPKYTELPSRDADVETFLNSIFEQVLPVSDQNITEDQLRTKNRLIAANIQGTDDTHRVYNDKDHGANCCQTQQIIPTTTSANIPGQPIIMMLPVDGRLFMTQGQHQSSRTQQNSSNELHSSENTAQTDAMNSNQQMISPVLQPMSVFLPSVIPRNVLDDILAQQSTTMTIRSSPYPETAQSPVNLDENSRVGQLNPTSNKARYVGPVHPITNEGMSTLELKNKISNKQQIENDKAPRHWNDNIYYDTPALRSNKHPSSKFFERAGTGNYQGEMCGIKTNISSNHNKVSYGNTMINEMGEEEMCDSPCNGDHLPNIYNETRANGTSGKINERYDMLKSLDDMCCTLKSENSNCFPHRDNESHCDNTDQSFLRAPPLPPHINLDEESINKDTVDDWIYDTQLMKNSTKDALAIYSYQNKTEGGIGDQYHLMSKVLGEKLENVDKKEKPAVHYVKQPWKLIVRREIFYPQDQLCNCEEVDLIFMQIIEDCKNWNLYRIRSYERESVSRMLTKLSGSYQIPPNALDNPSELPVEVKLSTIQLARSWPLYFCRMYPVIEHRENERVSRLLGISETGIRLICYNFEDKTEPLKIADHFEFGDIEELQFNDSRNLRLKTQKNMTLHIQAEQVDEIRKLVGKYISGSGKIRVMMRAIADYKTNDPNLLSFSKDDVIEVIIRNENEMAYIGDRSNNYSQTEAHTISLCNGANKWYFGRIDDRFGNFPVDYVEVLRRNETDDKYRLVEADENDLDNNNNSSKKFSMMQFALLYFRSPKKATECENAINQKKKVVWTWRQVAEKVKYTNRPITHSLLNLESNEADKLAQDAFLCIMRYMGDESLKRGQTYTDCVYELLMICYQHKSLRDEIYCQIMRQTTNNRSTRSDSTIRGWRLITILTAYFDCSQVLKPYLLNYLNEMAYDPRRPYHGTASICLQNLAKTSKYGGRKFLLSGREVEAITVGKHLKRQQYHLPGGHRRVINTQAVTVVEEIIQVLCYELNIRSMTEQQEFCMCYILEQEGTMKFLSNDNYILDICTELDHYGKKYFLFLKRAVWINPLRLDNALYIDVMFFQVVPDYLEGLLLPIKGEKLSASNLDDIIKLAILLHLADNEKPEKITASNISNLIPKNVVNLRPLEQWIGRVNKRLAMIGINMSKTEAKGQFLETLEKWQMFGSTFFVAQKIIDGNMQVRNCVITINKKGLLIMTEKDHDIISQFTFLEIQSTIRYSNDMGTFLDIKVGNCSGLKTVTIQTNQDAEISHLLGQYIYVDNENHGFINEMNIDNE